MFQNNDVVKFKTGKVLYLVSYLGDALILISLETNKNRYNVDESKLVLVRSAEPAALKAPSPSPELTVEELAARTEAAYANRAKGEKLLAERIAYEKDGRDGSYGRRILMALQDKPNIFAGLTDADKPRLAKRRAKNRVAKQSRKANR